MFNKYSRDRSFTATKKYGNKEKDFGTSRPLLDWESWLYIHIMCTPQ